MIKTLWGYGAFQHDDKKFYSWITPGTQLSLGKFLMQADYYYGYRDVDYSEEVNDISLGRRYVRDQSVSLNFRYDFGIWKAMAKGVWNQRHDMNYQSVAYESWGAQAALEFYPFKNSLLKDFRFHAAYYYNETNFKNTFHDLNSVGEHTFLVGIKWFFKAK
jgi:hypothetical protein